MMSTCRACGKQGAFNLELQSNPTHATRLLDKLFIVARVHLVLEQTPAICFTCAYKIEETYNWLSNVKQYQDEQRVRRNLDARVDRINRTKQVKETIVKEKFWKENLTFNFSCIDDEEEQMPNAQHYVSKNDKQDMKEAPNHNKAPCYKENPVNDVINERSSSPFSFMPLERPYEIHGNEKKTMKPKTQMEINNFDPAEEMLTFNFSQFTETNEKQRFKLHDLGHNVRQIKKSNIQDEILTFNFTSPGTTTKEVPFKNPKFSGWNLSRTFKTTKKPIEQKYPYNLRGQGTRDFAKISKTPKSKIQETLNKPRLKAHKSIDIFASQDSCPSSGVLSAGWELTPDDNLIQKVRAKLKKVEF